jgi:hypothetical protein
VSLTLAVRTPLPPLPHLWMLEAAVWMLRLL